MCHHDEVCDLKPFNARSVMTALYEDGIPESPRRWWLDRHAPHVERAGNATNVRASKVVHPCDSLKILPLVSNKQGPSEPSGHLSALTAACIQHFSFHASQGCMYELVLAAFMPLALLSVTHGAPLGGAGTFLTASSMLQVLANLSMAFTCLYLGAGRITSALVLYSVLIGIISGIIMQQ